MLYDLRYYSLTIAAVFLALGLGIFLGSTMLVNNVLVDEQVALVGQLEADFQRLRGESHRHQAELASLQAALRRYEEFAEASLPYLVRGRLVGRTVLLLDWGGSPESTGVGEVLRLAGARVYRWPGSTAPVPRSPAARQSLEEYLQGVAGDAVVLVAGPGATATPFRGLMEILRRRGVTLIAAETSGAEPSLVPLYQRYGVSSVDNAEGVPGKVALVWLLEGARGHYGVKASAQGLLPRPGD